MRKESGKGLKTKINVNLGISGDCRNYEVEMEKVKLAVDYGAESIMDLSNYGKTHDFRRALIELFSCHDRYRTDVRRGRISGKRTV